MPDFEFWALGGYQSPTECYKPTRNFLDRSWSSPKSSGHIKKNSEKSFSNGEKLFFKFLNF